MDTKHPLDNTNCNKIIEDKEYGLLQVNQISPVVNIHHFYEILFLSDLIQIFTNPNKST